MDLHGTVGGIRNKTNCVQELTTAFQIPATPCTLQEMEEQSTDCYNVSIAEKVVAEVVVVRPVEAAGLEVAVTVALAEVAVEEAAEVAAICSTFIFRASRFAAALLPPAAPDPDPSTGTGCR